MNGAILDINVGGEMVFPLIDLLLARRVPLSFATGYDANSIPTCYSYIERTAKPLQLGQVAEAIGRAIDSVPYAVLEDPPMATG
jgi:hypothetical protein